MHVYVTFSKTDGWSEQELSAETLLALKDELSTPDCSWDSYVVKVLHLGDVNTLHYIKKVRKQATKR